jgi:hypothetical protein
MTALAALFCGLAVLSTAQQHRNAEVCLLQTGFMQRQELEADASQATPAPFRLADYNSGGTNFQEAIQQLAANTHTGARPPPCCGSLGGVVGEADPGSCTKVGVSELNAMLHNRDASDTFGDNVGIDKYEYFLEDCLKAGDGSDCTYTEITDPDIDGHIFKVGVTYIKIRAIDISKNQYECMRTVYLYDKQPPHFADPDFEPMHPNNDPDEINVEVPPEACIVKNEDGFIRHAELGFDADGADNCDVAGMTHYGLRTTDPEGVHLRKLIYTYDANAGLGTSDAKLLYDSDDASTSATSTSAGLEPGTYHMVYMLVDDFSEPFSFPDGDDLPEWHQFNHSLLLTVKDKTPPTAIDQCPEDISIEIEPTEMSTTVNWTVPKVSEDNCLGTGEAPPPPVEFEDKHPGMTMEVGAHIVKYAFHDAHGNAYGEECQFEVKITHKKHPVTVTCPELDPFDTLLNSDFAIVSWDTPVAMQNGEILDSSHIKYEPSVAPGMPFPFGETTIKVIATGKNYTAVQEGHQELEKDECYFKVQVGDPQSPKCDGRQYRCSASSSGTKPYGLCDGPEIEIAFHSDFDATHVYESVGVEQLVNEACCTSEEDVEHECSVIAGTGSKQCTPASR